jgi:hypothetical protein
MPRNLALSVAMCLLAVGPLCADESTSATMIPAEHTELIRQLGDTSFATRDAATKALLREGLAAKPALMQALKNPDLEIRLRAHQLLVLVMQQEFEMRMAAFVADVNGKLEHDLPSWKLYQKEVGSDRAARELFVEMLKAESSLLEACEASDRRIDQLLATRIQSLQGIGVVGFQQQQQVTPATLATLLFLATSMQPSQNNSLVVSQMYSLLSQPMAKQSITTGARSGMMTKLLETWIVRGTDATTAYYGLLLSLNYDLKDASLNAGRNLLKQNSPQSSSLQYAAIAIGRFGGKEDVPLLEKHLTNTTVCHTWHNPKFKDLIKIEIRDIVLAMLVRLTGQSHKDYGYDLLLENPTTLYHIYTFGFPEPAQRDKALAKWEAWKAAQPK